MKEIYLNAKEILYYFAEQYFKNIPGWEVKGVLFPYQIGPSREICKDGKYVAYLDGIECGLREYSYYTEIKKMLIECEKETGLNIKFTYNKPFING